MNSNMSYKVIDNFLPDSEFVALRNQMINPDFPWYYHPGTAGEGAENIYDFQFVHVFYWQHSWRTNLSHLMTPIVDKISPKSLIKIKANLTTVTPKNIRGGWHTDYDFPCKTAVLYLNDNNGYTEFENGERVESIANRFVEFDSMMSHVGVTATNSSERVLINFNYFS